MISLTSWPIRTAVPAERARLRDIFWRASLTNEGDREALLAGAEEHVLPDAPLDESVGFVRDGDVATPLGVGLRMGFPGLEGVFRLDIGKGLRDGATALSFVYEP